MGEKVVLPQGTLMTESTPIPRGAKTLQKEREACTGGDLFETDTSFGGPRAVFGHRTIRPERTWVRRSSKRTIEACAALLFSLVQKVKRMATHVRNLCLPENPTSHALPSAVDGWGRTLRQ